MEENKKMGKTILGAISACIVIGLIVCFVIAYNNVQRNNSQESDIFKTSRKNVLQKGFNNIISSREGFQIIQRLQNIKNNNENGKKSISKEDESFLTELLFRLLDC